MHRHRNFFVARHHRHHGCQVAAGTFAAHRDARRVAIDFARVREGPQVRGVGVVRRGRERVLRRQVIIHRHHDRVGHLRQRARRRIVRLGVGDHKTATMIIDHDRKRPFPRGRINMNGEIAQRPGNHQIFDRDACLRRRAAAGVGEHFLDRVNRRWLLARFLRRQRIKWLATQCAECVEHFLHRWLGLGRLLGRRRLEGNAEQGNCRNRR